MFVRQLVNLPRLTEIIEKRKQKFMDRCAAIRLSLSLSCWRSTLRTCFCDFISYFCFIMCISVLF